MTLASKRKMSQRQKTSRSSQSTQTDVSSSSWSLLDAAAINGIVGDPPSCSNSEMTLSPASPAHASQGSTSSSTTATAAASASQSLNGEFYEDAATMFDKLVKAEEVGRCVSVTYFCHIV